MRIRELAPDPKTKIVVNCAGRTRSIIGAQTLIDLGVPNPVLALENGTQGWLLAGLELEYGATRRYPDIGEDAKLDAERERSRKVAEARGVRFIDADALKEMLAESDRTTYVFDVRTKEEFKADGAPGTVHAPGCQLVQATDQWVGVRNARIVVADSEGVRAGMVASWLRQLGHDACVMEGGIVELSGMKLPPLPGAEYEALPQLSRDDVKLKLEEGAQLVDLRESMTYRDGHIDGATWSIRPRIGDAVGGDASVVLVADDPGIAALAAFDLRQAGKDVPGMLGGDPVSWAEAGLPITKSPDTPADADCIDFLFLTPERNQGNLDDARAYLAWEVGLIEQLDEQERGVFRITPAP